MFSPVQPFFGADRVVEFKELYLADHLPVGGHYEPKVCLKGNKTYSFELRR